MDKLDDKQRAFAEQHHNLIYSFLNQSKLNEDDFYDIAAIGYLKCVKKYFDEEKLQKYAFSTIAYKTMNREVHNYFNYLTRKKRKADVISLNASYYDQEASFIGNVGVDDQSFEEKILDIEIASLLTPNQFTIAKLLTNGLSHKQLKDKTSVSMKEISQQVTAIRFRLANLIDSKQKQKICIDGRLARPLQIGYQAYFLVGDKVSVTPVVTSIIAECENAAIFETAARIYEIATQSANAIKPV